MSRKALIIILIVSIGINLGLLGFMALDAYRESRFFHEGRALPHWLETIKGITPEQKDQIKAIMTDGHDSIEALKSDLFQKRYELNLLIAEKNPDPAAIDAKITEISALQAQMERLIVQDIIAIRAVLTPEQQQMLVDFMGRHMMPPPPGSSFGGPMGPGRGMGHRWGLGGSDR
jgi:Spy/CpxP family protein refolding chaperone